MYLNLRFLCVLSVAVAWWLTTTLACTAQPKGWPCDYAYRPGNMWFYFNWDEPNRLRSQSVVYDSIGADGAYWVYLKDSSSWGRLDYHWMRIDTACNFDSYNHPSDRYFRRMLKAHAKIGDRWTVDSTEWSLSHARISRSSTRSKEVVYFVHSLEHGDFHEGTMIYSEGVGMVHYFGHSGPVEELVGWVIDGKRHGTTTSGIEDNRTRLNAEHMTVRPMPAATTATVHFTVHGTFAAILTVHNALGYPVYRDHMSELADGPNAATLNLSGLAPGTYLIRLDLGDEFRTTPLIIIR